MMTVVHGPQVDELVPPARVVEGMEMIAWKTPAMAKRLIGWGLSLSCTTSYHRQWRR